MYTLVEIEVALITALALVDWEKYKDSADPHAQVWLAPQRKAYEDNRTRLILLTHDARSADFLINIMASIISQFTG